MDGGTPKKIVDSDSKCFTCSSPSANAENIYIFGKSSIDLQGILKSSLNVDVSCFANSGKIRGGVLKDFRGGNVPLGPWNP